MIRETSNLLKNGLLTILYESGNIKLYKGNIELTSSVGLNIAINAAGIWSDSSQGTWEILEKRGDSVVVRNTWKNLPISCLWRVGLDKDGHILCAIDMEAEEFLELDERRFIILVSPLYKTWINSYEEGKFPQVIGWQDMPLENFCSKLVGVRFSKDNALPPMALEYKENESGRIYPLIQNTSVEIGSHVIGVKMEDDEDNKCYRKGTYSYFSGKIFIFKDEAEFDRKIENKRSLLLNSERRKSKVYKNRKTRVLLANMPWQKDGMLGVRAGSRWPHIKDVSEGNYMPFPFFLTYTASLLEKNNVDVAIRDFIAEGVSREKFIKGLPKIEFDILITETSTPSFYYDMELLKNISYLDVPVVLCGTHPEIYDTKFLERNSFIDFVAYGEYEFTILELVKSLVKGDKEFSHVDGLIWRDERNNVIKNKRRKPFDINMLPWPHRETLPLEKYWDLPGNIPSPSVQMVASRGCPYACNFCLWPQILFGGRIYRVRDVDDVVNEMEYLIKEKGFKSVYFDDDTFNIGKDRMLKLCGEIVKRKLNNVPWAVMARADLMDEEILDRMKEAGLYAVKYGVENASQELVDRCGKRLDLKKADRMIKYTKSLGVKVHLTFTFGLPGETKQSIKKSIDYALKSGPSSVQFSILTPFPGTELFDELDKHDRIMKKDWSLYDGHYSCIFKPDNLSTAELEEAKQYAYRLWADHERQKRGLSGELKRFLAYYKDYGLERALSKTTDYINYVFFKRKRFIGKI